MKNKTFNLVSIISVVIGAVMLFFSVALPLITLANADSGTIGIIGGADGPTAQFTTMRLIGSNLLPICFGGALFISGLFCLVFSKTVRNCCYIKTTALALGISATGGFGLGCFLLWAVIAGFGEISTYPIDYSASILVGFGCFFLFILLIAFYIKQRMALKSVKGFIIDVITSILFLPSFFWLFQWVYRLVD